MENQIVSFKKVFILAGAFLAFYIGSGFATGQEVMQYATVHGIETGLAIIATLAVMLIFFVYTLYGLAQKVQFENPYDVFEYYCGKKLGAIYTWFTVLLSYGTFVLMLSAGGNAFHQYYDISVSIGSFVVGVLVVGTVLLGGEKLINIIGVIGPVKTVFLAIMGFAALALLSKQPGLLSVNNELIQNSGFLKISGNWLWSGILWGVLGLMTGIVFFVINGESCKNVKEAKLGGVLGVCAVTVVIVLMVLMEVVYLDVIKGKQVLTLEIAKQISPALGMLFAPILILCIYSAGSSILLSVVRKFAADRAKNFSIYTIALALIALFASTFLPFDRLVNILFPIAGYLGIPLTVLMIYKEYINKNAFPYHKNIEASGQKNEETV